MKKLIYAVIISIIFISIYMLLNYITNGWIDKNVPDSIVSFLLVILVVMISDKLFQNNSELQKKRNGSNKI